MISCGYNEQGNWNRTAIANDLDEKVFAHLIFSPFIEFVLLMELL